MFPEHACAISMGNPEKLFEHNGTRTLDFPFRFMVEWFLNDFQGLARATSLRAKFEKWEAEENERNVAFEKESPSIESTKDLRAKFENLKREEEEKLRKRREVKVNRFVVRQ